MNSLLRPKGLMQSYLSFALSAGGGCPEIWTLDPYCVKRGTPDYLLDLPNAIVNAV
jgi:hypothetical protein